MRVRNVAGVRLEIYVMHGGGGGLGTQWGGALMQRRVGMDYGGPW